MNLPGLSEQEQSFSDRKVRVVFTCKSSNSPVKEEKGHPRLGRGGLVLVLALIQIEGLAGAVSL